MDYRSSAVVSLFVSMAIPVLLCGNCGAAVSDSEEPGSDYYQLLGDSPLLGVGELFTIDSVKCLLSPDFSISISISLTAMDDAIPSSRWRCLPYSLWHQSRTGLWGAGIVDWPVRCGEPMKLPLIGLNIFRSRHSKRRFRPANDSDPWQIIFGSSTMIC